MSIISRIEAIEVLDSRGYPTICVKVILENNHYGLSIVPAGASTGKYEAVELRDNDHRYMGKGVKNSLRMIRQEIFPALEGFSCYDQYNIDRTLIELDDSPDKHRLGANSILAVSLAVARAAAADSGLSLYRYLGGMNARILPIPMMNIINGGCHASNDLAIQEFMIVPAGFCSFAEALRAGSEIYHHLGELLSRSGNSAGVGDEGGFAPSFSSTEEALDFIMRAIEAAGRKIGEEIHLALDIAASQFFNDGVYKIEGKDLSNEELSIWYEKLVNKYPIISIEDGMHEDDSDGWRHLTGLLGDRINLVGDDLFVTNPEKFSRGIGQGIANSILIKFNQIGTLSETLEVLEMARDNGYKAIISHRSGESEDTMISDLAVSSGCGWIKTGAPARSERTAKYNRLLFIESELEDYSRYAGNLIKKTSA